MNYRQWSNFFLISGMMLVVISIAVPDKLIQGIVCGVMSSSAFMMGWFRRDALFGAMWEERKEQNKAQDDTKPKT